MRNLLHAKQSLMGKNIFRYINDEDILWVDILRAKYSIINFWKNSTPAGCSWFFKALCNVAFKLCPFFWLSFINPNQTSFLFHNWCTDIPLALNLTYINMSFDLENSCVDDFISSGSWDINKLNLLFGTNLECFSMRLGSIEFNAFNHWVWFPESQHSRILEFPP